MGIRGRQQWRVNPLVAIAAAGLLILAGCTSHSAPRGDVLLIVVDTLRADHVGIDGYARATTPNIDRFFRKGEIFTNSYSAASNTSPSVISILSGEIPQVHGVRLLYQLLSPKVKILPDELPEVYQTAAVVSNIVLTNEALGIANRFDHYDDFVNEREPYRNIYERRASRTTDAALRWLKKDADPKRPLFLWVHYIDPHGPYKTPPDWKKTFHHAKARPIDPRRVPRFERFPGVTDGNTYVDDYDEEIAYTDAQVGRLLAGYAALRPIDKTLVIFTADHGESMMEHERWFTHGYEVYQEIDRVPLLLRGPGVEPGRCKLPVQGIDIAPTVLRFAGARIPSTISQVDLRSRRGLGPNRMLFLEATQGTFQWRGVVRNGKKWTLAVRGDRRIVAARMYNLRTDPHELRPFRYQEDGAAARDLVRLVKTDPDPAGIPPKFRKGMMLNAPKVAPRVPKTMLSKLRALGYVE